MSLTVSFLARTGPEERALSLRVRPGLAHWPHPSAGRPSTEIPQSAPI